MHTRMTGATSGSRGMPRRFRADPLGLVRALSLYPRHASRMTSCRFTTIPGRATPCEGLASFVHDFIISHRVSLPLPMSRLSGSQVDDDLPVDEYARLHGLSVDFHNALLSSSASRVPTILGAVPLDILDDCALPPLQIPPLSIGDDKPTVSKQSLMLLDQALNAKADTVVPIPCRYLRSVARQADLRFEPPIFPSDHEHECRQLMKCVAARTSTCLNSKQCPYEPLNASQDEALTFPPSAYLFQQHLEHFAHNEKLDASRATLLHLSTLLQGNVEEQGLAAAGLLSELPSKASLISPIPYSLKANRGVSGRS
jgi:hypothetical protein